MSTRKVYTGNKRKLIIAFDLGTTFSGASFAILDPGKIPRIQTVSRYVPPLHGGGRCSKVNRYPGQETGDAKIPTVIYYDQEGKPLALGAEEPPLVDEDDDENWHDEPLKLEWCV